MIRLEEFPRKRLFTHPFISPVTSLMTSVKERDKRYKNGLKRALLIGIIFQFCFFQVFPKKYKIEFKIPDIEPVDVIVENIPQTEQLEQAPPPPRPSVPIPSEDPNIPEDLTISETDLNFDELPPPAPPPPSTEDEGFVFIAYDSPPEAIGGYESVLQYIKYPEIARRAGVECAVIIGVLVDEQGNSVKTQILKDSGAELGFEEAAQNAVMKMKWIAKNKP